MTLTYIFNSCFALVDDDLTIVFDFYKDTEDSFLQKTILPQTKKLYVLASHSHYDHYTSDIFKWEKQIPDTKYILSFDINHDKSGDNITTLNKLDTYKDDNLYIKSYGSTDLGLSYYVEYKSMKIFHAGDLNNWHWNEEADHKHIKQYEEHYYKELALITKDISDIDLLMFPLDSRLGKDYAKGLIEFTENINVKRFVPMHFQEDYGFLSSFTETAKRKNINYYNWKSKDDKRIILKTKS